MEAKTISDMVVSYVKKSKLNYSIQESPFSLLINIRKSFIRNKQGDQLPPSSDTFSEMNTAKVKSDKIEEESLSLKTNVNHLEVALDASLKDLHDLSIKLEKAKKEIQEAMADKNSFVKENKRLELKLRDKDTEIKTIKSESKDLKSEVETLKNEIKTENKNVKSKEKEITRLDNKGNNLAESVKNFKTEIKILIGEKKELFAEKTKLEKQLSTITMLTKPLICSKDTQTDENQNQLSRNSALASSPRRTAVTATSCTSCSLSSGSSTTYSPSSSNPSTSSLYPTLSNPSSRSSPCSIPLHKPIHPWNSITLTIPAHGQIRRSKCDHSTQCVIRQPWSPPFPSITFLINEKSKYDQHMMEWSREEFGGCFKCFSVDNENYG